MIQLKHSYKSFVQMESSAGAYIGSVISEAIQVAMNENVPVRFTFNGKLYTVDPSSLVDIVYKTATTSAEAQ